MDHEKKIVTSLADCDPAIRGRVVDTVSAVESGLAYAICTWPDARQATAAVACYAAGSAAVCATFHSDRKVCETMAESFMETFAGTLANFMSLTDEQRKQKADAIMRAARSAFAEFETDDAQKEARTSTKQ